VFVSSAYVPVASMAGWLRPVAEHQPVTPMVNAVRGLAGGPRVEALLAHTTAYYVGLSLIWATAIMVVFGVVAAVRFSRR
jgi:ABC-2 type transport system permease protein